jgi:hypothetical protein
MLLESDEDATEAEKKRDHVEQVLRVCVACRRTKCACWDCRACTRRNVKSVSVCDTCSIWRYSDAVRL